MEDWTISSEKDVIAKMAYSIGAFLDDGMIRHRPEYRAWELQIWKQDPEVVEHFLRAVNDVFNERYTTTTRTDNGVLQYGVRIGQHDICNWMALITNWRQEIPKELFGMREVWPEFLAGLMDTDGWVNYAATGGGSGGPRWNMGFSNTNLKLVQEVATMWQKFGIRLGKISTQPRKGYVDYHHARANMSDWAKSGLYFYVERKNERVRDYCKHVLGSETLYAGDRVLQDKVQSIGESHGTN
jgi:intein/homing endonuclease